MWELIDEWSEEAGGTEAVQGPVEWVRDKLGFEPDKQQARVLECGSKRGILNCTRQWGKSTVTAAKVVHHAWTEPRSLSIVVSPSARQSGEFVRKAAGFVAGLCEVRGDGDNEMSIALPNGSRIVGLPGSEATVRGFSAVSLLVVDEASRVDDALYMAIRPMLAVSQGTLWLMSTPFGKRGFFYDVWTKGGKDWVRVRVTAEQCPRIPNEFLAEERAAMGERWYRQEYCCEFENSVSGVFDMESVEGALEDLAPLQL